ncbi:hypothetical protein DFH06DRAFT_1164586 [Mycena polygramma]|nr:hypothetical protein DFH06DRAFT_1164586 [Mycena polygramma]
MSTVTTFIASIVGPLISRRTLASSEGENLEDILTTSTSLKQDPFEAETMHALLPYFQRALQDQGDITQEECEFMSQDVPQELNPAALLIGEGDKLVTQALELMNEKSDIMNEVLLESLADMYDRLKEDEDGINSGRIPLTIEVATKYLGDAERLLRRSELTVKMAELSPGDMMKMMTAARSSK